MNAAPHKYAVKRNIEQAFHFFSFAVIYKWKGKKKQHKIPARNNAAISTLFPVTIIDVYSYAKWKTDIPLILKKSTLVAVYKYNGNQYLNINQYSIWVLLPYYSALLSRALQGRCMCNWWKKFYEKIIAGVFFFFFLIFSYNLLKKQNFSDKIF